MAWGQSGRDLPLGSVRLVCGGPWMEGPSFLPASPYTTTGLQCKDWSPVMEGPDLMLRWVFPPGDLSSGFLEDQVLTCYLDMEMDYPHGFMLEKSINPFANFLCSVVRSAQGSREAPAVVRMNGHFRSSPSLGQTASMPPTESLPGLHLSQHPTLLLISTTGMCLCVGPQDGNINPLTS